MIARLLLAWCVVVAAIGGGPPSSASELAPKGDYVLTWKKVEAKGGIRVGVSVNEKGRKSTIDGGVLNVSLAARGANVTGCTVRDRTRPQTPVMANCSMRGGDLIIALGDKDASDLRFELKPQGSQRYSGEALVKHPLLPSSIVFGSAELVATANR